jgi:DNA-binding NarL/FixJ family response regulator
MNGVGAAVEIVDKWGVASSLQRLGHLAYRQGDYVRARALQQESLTLFRQLDDKVGVTISLQFLGTLALEGWDYEAARALFEEGLAISRQLGDKARTGYSLGQLGETARLQGDYAAARTFYEQTLAIYRELGNKSSIAVHLHNLGHVAHREGDHAQATELFRESLVISMQLGSKEFIAWCLAGLAGVAGTLGQARRAATLFGAAQTLLEVIGAVIEPSDRMEYERNVATARAGARARLDEEAFEAAWLEGQGMTMEQAVALALEETLRPVPSADAAKLPGLPATARLRSYPNGLTRREVEVLSLVAEGLTDAQVAARLFLSPHTVHAHLTSIYSKLGVTTRHAAARFALQHDLT